MISRDGLPETPDWHPEPHDCPCFDLAPDARGRIDCGCEIPENITLGAE